MTSNHQDKVTIQVWMVAVARESLIANFFFQSFLESNQTFLIYSQRTTCPGLLDKRMFDFHPWNEDFIGEENW